MVFGVLDVFDRQPLSTPARQDADWPMPCSAKKGSIDHRADWQLKRASCWYGAWPSLVEFGRVWLEPLGVGIDEGLLIESANTLDRASIEIVLAVKIARVSRIKPE